MRASSGPVVAVVVLSFVIALGTLLAGCPAPAVTPTVASSTASTVQGAVTLCEHRVPAELCTVCHPALAAVFRSQGDWCDEHGVPESQCLTCHPTLTFQGGGAAADWCGEHGVPESKCTKCHPELVAGSVAAGDFCREHGFPWSVCPVCHPERPGQAGQAAPVFPAKGTRIRLESVATAKDAGIATVTVRRAAITSSLEVTGQVAFNGNKEAQVSAPHAARVVEVLVDIGDRVKAGQGLVVLASAVAGFDRAQVAAATAKLTAARAALGRVEQLEGIRAQRDLDDARRDVTIAEAEEAAALASVKASGAEVSSSSSSSSASGGRLVLTAPLAGTVVGRSVVPGRTVTAGEILVEVADTRTLWGILDVPELHSAVVAEGQPVELRFEGLRSEPRQGTIARVAARIDPHTRTLRARVDLDNADLALKAGLFLRARIQTSGEREGLVVPASAIQRMQGRTVAFVVVGPGLYEPRAVDVAPAAGDGGVEVVGGVQAGDEVVTTGAFLLKTELMKDAIGAGCCE